VSFSPAIFHGREKQARSTLIHVSMLDMGHTNTLESVICSNQLSD